MPYAFTLSTVHQWISRRCRIAWCYSLPRTWCTGVAHASRPWPASANLFACEGNSMRRQQCTSVSFLWCWSDIFAGSCQHSRSGCASRCGWLTNGARTCGGGYPSANYCRMHWQKQQTVGPSRLLQRSSFFTGLTSKRSPPSHNGLTNGLPVLPRATTILRSADLHWNSFGQTTR